MLIWLNGQAYRKKTSIKSSILGVLETKKYVRK